MANPHDQEIKPDVAHVELDSASIKSEKHLDEHLHLKSDQDDIGYVSTFWRFRKAVFICTLMCLAAAADGYQVNLNGSIIANLGFTRKIGILNSKGKYVLNANQTALWGAMQSLGQMISMVCLNTVSDRIGRKWTLYLLWIILVASLLLETFVQNWQMWTGAKLLAGLGVGAIQSTLPVYITEWAPNNIRGAMLMSYGIWNNIGNFLAPCVLLGSERRDPYDYKTPILTQWGFLGVMLPIFLYIPETPWYFASKGFHEKGVKALKRVNGGIPGYKVEEEYAVIVNTIEEERRMKFDMGLEAHSWRDILRSYLACFKGVNAKRTLSASLPTVCQQTNGLALLNIYGALFFRQAGFSNAFEIKVILTAMKILGVLLVIFTSDRTGRRRPVLIASWVCNIMLVLVGALGLYATQSNQIRTAIVACSCLWAIASATLGTSGWTYVGEVPTQKLRARTAGLAAAIGVIFGLTFNTSVPIMLDANGRNLGYNAAWIFVGVGAIANVLAIFYCPETAQRNPAELDEMYEKRIPAWRMRKYVTDVQTNHEQRKQLRATQQGGD